MPFAVGLSHHPLTAAAVGEVLGEVIESGGIGPDLCLVFVSSHHADFALEISNAVAALLQPGTTVGITTTAPVGGACEVEEGPAMVVWAAWIGAVEALPLEVRRGETRTGVEGIEPADLPDGATLLLLAGHGVFPTEAFVESMHASRPDVAVVGGVSSSPDTVLFVDGRVHAGGAVAVVLDARQVVGPIVSQGCRPIGEPMVVTESNRHLVFGLAGEPALDRLEKTVADLPPDDRPMLRRGIQVGLVIDERSHEFGTGAFLVRSLLGADKTKRVLAVGADVAVGRTLQFQLRDASAADAEFRELLDGVHGAGALLFTCTARGVDLFGVENHDAEIVCDMVGTSAVAGMACSNEVGPVGGRSHVHASTASVLVFDDAAWPGSETADAERGR